MGSGRPGSAGYIYRHGWIPVAGSGAVDKRSKAKQKAVPSAPPNPQLGTPARPVQRRAEFAELSDEQVESRVKMFTNLAAADDLSDSMRDTVRKALADLEVERQIRKGDLVEAPPIKADPPQQAVVAPSVATPSQKKAAAKVERNLQVSPEQTAEPPQHNDPGRLRITPTHTGLFHATPASSAESIRQTGFRQSTGSGENGAFFGVGTYFHTREDDAQQSLDGYRAFIDPDMEHVRAEAEVNNPFVVRATGRDVDPAKVMLRAMVEAGLASPGERLTPDAITQRLKQAGHDGVEVKQDEFNHEIAGNQLVVFDASKQTRVQGAAGRVADVQVQTN